MDIVGIANLVTFLENTGSYRRSLREPEYGSLENDGEFLESISPIHKADRITAPLMVIHGKNDPRVPVGEAEQIVEKVRENGGAVEYLLYEDEGHGLAKLKTASTPTPGSRTSRLLPDPGLTAQPARLHTGPRRQSYVPYRRAQHLPVDTRDPEVFTSGLELAGERVPAPRHNPTGREKRKVSPNWQTEAPATAGDAAEKK